VVAAVFANDEDAAIEGDAAGRGGHRRDIVSPGAR